MKLKRAGGLAFLAAVLLCAAACSDGNTIVNTPGSTSGISVSGTGRVAVSPDIVILQLGVDAEASTVAQAREMAASSMQAVIDSLQSNGVAERDIQTVQFSVSPVYDFNGRNQVLRGYHVTNVVSATLRKVDDASKVIDSAAVAGGNTTVIRGITFDVENRAEAESQARAAAIAEARARADQLADEAGVGLGSVLSISESNQQVFYQNDGLVRAPQTGAADTASPIQAGQLEVVIQVNVLYSID